MATRRKAKPEEGFTMRNRTANPELRERTSRRFAEHLSLLFFLSAKPRGSDTNWETAPEDIYINSIQANKKAEREAAELPPSRSDQWLAKFRRKFCAVRFRLRSVAVSGRAAAGSVADFLRYTLFLENIFRGGYSIYGCTRGIKSLTIIL